MTSTTPTAPSATIPEPTISMDTLPAPFVTAAPSRALSIVSVVTAIVSIPLGHTVILPIVAIVLGFVARRREPAARVYSTWGIIVGFVVLFGWIALGAIAASIWLPLALVHHLF